MKAKKQLILDTALELFGSHGIHNTTVQMVLDVSGISKGTFYKYFDSKDDIVKCLLERHQQDEYLLRQELEEGNYGSEFDLLVDQLAVPMTLPSRARLSRVFWESVNTADLNLADYTSVQIKWIAGRFVDVFGEEKRPYSIEAALLYVGMVRQVAVLWKTLHGDKIDWKMAVPKILRYVEAILRTMEEDGEGIIHIHAVGELSGGTIVNLEKLKGMLEEFLDSIKDKDMPEEAIQYALGLNILLEDGGRNKPMIGLTLPAFKRAFKGTAAEREAHMIVLFCKLYMDQGEQ